MSSRTRSSAFAASQSAPSSSSMRESSERRSGSHKARRARELTCESCGKVYKHPVCLQKHRWEHNPLWRDTAQLLLSKHQQVQVMEAAAILVHGAALPSDKALWPSYTSGGTLASPVLAGDGTLREQTPQFQSPPPPSSSAPFDDDELAEISEEEIGGDEDDEEVGPQIEAANDEEDENTDDSDVPSAFHPASAAHQYNMPAGGRGRSQSVGGAAFGASVSSHMPNLSGVGSRVVPSSLAMTSYGWGVISDAGKHAGSSVYATPKSPTLSEMSPRSPVAIPSANMYPPSPFTAQQSSYIQVHQQGNHRHTHHRSISSFSSFTHSFGSSATSSYIPSSSVRSSDLLEEVGDREHHMLTNEEEEDESGEYYNYQRATNLARRITFTRDNTAELPKRPHHAGGSSAFGGSDKSNSPERRADEDMYEMEMD